jgi:hypothetical protein
MSTALLHTKGTWRLSAPAFGLIHVSSDHTVGGAPCKSGRQAICSLPYAGKKATPAYHQMFAANALLIVAAPEMLDVLIALAGPDDGDIPDLQRARAVIAKATGGMA